MGTLSLPPPPPILRGPLVFGDPRQIAAIRSYESKIAAYEEGELRPFSVDIEISGSSTVQILARSKAEAEAKAELNVKKCFDDLDIDISAYEVERWHHQSTS